MKMNRNCSAAERRTTVAGLSRPVKLSRSAKHGGARNVHTVTDVPSNLVKVNPEKRSAYVVRKSVKMPIATAPPDFSPSMPSERQCTPAVSRPSARFAASLFSSPPAVSAVPLYGNRESPEEWLQMPRIDQSPMPSEKHHKQQDPLRHVRYAAVLWYSWQS